jgi:magnesium-transporting ATPase (P-type)
LSPDASAARETTSSQSGSQATRGVADIVLLGDSFAALPIAFREGQRIIKGMEDIVRLLMTRTFYVMLLVIATQVAGVAFPVTPKHNSVMALLTVGIPILAIKEPSVRGDLHSWADDFFCTLRNPDHTDQEPDEHDR